MTHDLRSRLLRYARSLRPGETRGRLFEILDVDDDGHRAFEAGESVTIEAVVIDDLAGKTYGAVHVRVPEGSDTEGLLDGIDLLVPANILTRVRPVTVTYVPDNDSPFKHLHTYPHNKEKD